MDNVIMRQGMRFLNNVGNCTFNDNTTGSVIFTATYATAYAIAIGMTSQDTRGGAGNALLYRSYSDRTVDITLTLQEWDLGYVAASVGSRIETGLAEIFVIEQSIGHVNGIVTLIPGKVAIGTVSVRLPNNARIEVTPTAGNTIDLTAFGLEDGDCVFVTYPFNVNAKTVTITADRAPLVGRLIMQGRISDNMRGPVGNVSVDIPSFALDGNLTISMNADGTTSSTELAGTALAVDGRVCGEGSVYGYVREFVENDPEVGLSGIVASPSPIELVVADTQLINVVGLRGAIYSNIGIYNADCVFVSDTPAVATVDASGLITGVDVGDAVIEVTHTASGLTDEIDVTVVSAP